MAKTSVVNLFIHGPRSSREGDTEPTPMHAIQQVDAVEGCGLRQDERYFRRADPGRERPRQVSLIDEGTIWRHERFFGSIDRSLIKAQIILAGDVFLPDLLSAVLSFEGGAELTVSIHRQPCFAMDLIAFGLREAMQAGHQGALARVTKSGVIAVGQEVQISGQLSAVSRQLISDS
jgi:hypothetical protein